MNFAQARKNMVDCQIEPAGITDKAILEVFETTPRETFLTDNLKGISYTDEHVVFNDGRFVLEPVVHATMLEALAPEKHHIILDIGCTTGYSSAILSPLVTTVIALEQKQEYIDAAEKNWNAIDVCNAVAVKGFLKTGYAEEAPFDLIFCNGACATIPEQLIKQLGENGRMVFILQPDSQSVGKATLIEKGAGDTYASRTLFETSSPYLPGFEPQNVFNF